HDIDDGLKAGLLTMRALEKVSLWQSHFEHICQQHTNLTLTQQRRFTVNAIINHLVTDLIENTSANIDDLGIASIDDVRKRGKELVSFSAPCRQDNAELKEFLYRSLYTHPKVLNMQKRAKVVIAGLFNSLIKESKLIPGEFIAFYPQDEPQPRIVCDYVAGMTDRFALGEFDRLFEEIHH
ncbi:MAG TPA: deoxyguanosinetriphosphate triphosphohydrolase, partial [bacterium]|nr:deoxyguanosinetriphosphate triphosphohydrolase [bacterium]